MTTQRWVYRPSEDEHEALVDYMEEHKEFPSIAQLVREAVIRLIHNDQKGPMYGELASQIDSLKGLKDEFMSALLRESEE